MQDHHQAIQYHLKFLENSRIIGDRAGEGNSLVNLGAALVALGQYSEALRYWHIALEIFEKINARETEAYLLKNFAQLHYGLGSSEKALNYCDRASNLATELNLPLQQECEILYRKIRNTIKILRSQKY